MSDGSGERSTGAKCPISMADGLLGTPRSSLAVPSPVMKLIIDPTIGRFTRTELVQEMQDRFGDFTERTFRLWQEKGLIAAPRQDGRWRTGRTGTGKALWSGHDQEMLAILLEKRAEHRQGPSSQLQLSELANLVVWAWVFWDGFIALDQAKRALKCWAEPQIGGQDGTVRSRETLTRRVRAAVSQLAAPGTPARAQRTLAKKVFDTVWCHDLDGLRLLEPELDTLVDPDRCGRRVGAPGASIDAHGAIERLVRSQLAAHAVVTQKPVVRDKDWFAARGMLCESWAEYANSWATLRARSSTPDIFGPPGLELQISDCSNTLLYCLGSRIDPP